MQRRTPHIAHRLLLSGCLPWVLVGGCAAAPAPPAAHEPAVPAAAETLQRSAEGQAAALSAALARAPGGRPPSLPSPVDETQGVQWIEPRPRPAAPPPRPVTPTAEPPSVGPVAAATAEPSPPATQPAATRPAAVDRRALLEQLRSAVRQGSDRALDRAVVLVGLSLADPQQPIDPADLAGLDEPQRERVLRYHQALADLARQAAQGDKPLDAAALRQGVDQTVRPHATGLRIATVQLCQRVRGFGVYEPFDSSSFLAGRDQRIIVYAELENFRSQRTGEGGRLHQVKLQQETALYLETDGLEVWRQPAATIVDESRNERRDFFVVQLVELPARLSVGRYVLKVRITDLHGNTVDTAAVSLSLVADQSLVRAPTR